jgi:serine/threonine protein kinase
MITPRLEGQRKVKACHEAPIPADFHGADKARDLMTVAAQTNHGPCSDLIAAVLQHQLVPPARASVFEKCRQQVVRLGPEEAANLLVTAGVLTRFQADSILVGRGADLVVANFRLLEPLGNGSMGTVFKGRSTLDQQIYALKILPRRNVANLSSILDKVREMKNTHHPRVSALVRLGAQGERFYLAWPYLEGGQTLDEYIRTNGLLSTIRAVHVGSQIASGLLPYHDRGLFHGLLKPSDILFGDDRRIRVLDFGVGFLLACERGKSLLDTMTNSRAIAKGLDCSAPETHFDPLNRTPAGDRYSLGCILFYCVTGQFPFPNDQPLKKMLAHQTEAPPAIGRFNPKVSNALANLIYRLLSKRPEDRFGSTGELVEAFRALTSRRPGSPDESPADPASVTGGSAHQVVSPSRGLAAAEETPNVAEEESSRWRPPLGLWVGLALATGAAAGPFIYWLTAGR